VPRVDALTPTTGIAAIDEKSDPQPPRSRWSGNYAVRN
jgi:hypothetical protein